MTYVSSNYPHISITINDMTCVIQLYDCMCYTTFDDKYIWVDFNVDFIVPKIRRVNKYTNNISANGVELFPL